MPLSFMDGGNFVTPKIMKCFIFLTKYTKVLKIRNKLGVTNMKYRKVDIMPDMQETLSIMGEQIKMARLRRKISVNLAAERAGVSRATIWRVEKGDAGVAIGIYANVLHALNGLDKDLLLIAKDDELGRKLQDIEMATKKINRR